WAERGHTIVYGVREPEAPKSKDAATATGDGARVATAREAAADAEVVVLGRMGAGGARGEGLQHHGLAEHEGSRLRRAAGDDARVWRRRRGESRGGGSLDVHRVRGDRRRPAEDRAAARAARDAVDPPRAGPRDGHRDRVPPAAALGPELAARVGERGGDRLRQPRPELVVEVAEVGQRLEPLAAVHAPRLGDLRACEAQPLGVEPVGGGNPADRRLLGAPAAADPLDDPLQHADVVAVTRPEELAVLAL